MVSVDHSGHLQPIGQSELALTFGLVVHPVVLLPTSLIIMISMIIIIIAVVVIICTPISKCPCISNTFKKTKTTKTMN